MAKSDKDNLPEFLIIGAMKAGTTTLWSDLRGHPEVFMPESKEPETLRFSDAASAKGKQRYASLFRVAQPGQLCGEASTLYAKLPYSRNIAKRAREALGEELKLIYLVRDPIARAQSHHRHLWRERQAVPDFDAAVLEHPEIVDYGCYATQIGPWLEQFSYENLLSIQFERFVEDRGQTLEQVARFLGLKTCEWPIDEGARMKPGDAPTVLHVPLINDWFYRLRMTHTYKWLSELPAFSRAKQPIKKMLMRPVPAQPPVPPSRSMIEYMVERYEPEAARFADLVGWPKPIWDLRTYYLDQSAGKQING